MTLRLHVSRQPINAFFKKMYSYLALKQHVFYMYHDELFPPPVRCLTNTLHPFAAVLATLSHFTTRYGPPVKQFVPPDLDSTLMNIK